MGSKETFGPLTGIQVFCFDGWKLRWDYSSFSNQASKTYTDPLGRRWHLVKDVECWLGHQIAKGGDAAAAARKLVDDAKAIEQLHADTFTQGTIRSREHDGSYEYCV